MQNEEISKDLTFLPKNLTKLKTSTVAILAGVLAITIVLVGMTSLQVRSTYQHFNLSTAASSLDNKLASQEINMDGASYHIRTLSSTYNKSTDSIRMHYGLYTEKSEKYEYIGFVEFAMDKLMLDGFYDSVYADAAFTQALASLMYHAKVLGITDIRQQMVNIITSANIVFGESFEIKVTKGEGGTPLDKGLIMNGNIVGDRYDITKLEVTEGSQAG